MANARTQETGRSARRWRVTWPRTRSWWVPSQLERTSDGYSHRPTSRRGFPRHRTHCSVRAGRDWSHGQRWSRTRFTVRFWCIPGPATAMWSGSFSTSELRSRRPEENYMYSKGSITLNCSQQMARSPMSSCHSFVRPPNHCTQPARHPVIKFACADLPPVRCAADAGC